MSQHELLTETPSADVPVEREVLVPEGTTLAALLPCLEVVFSEDESLAAVAVSGVAESRRFVSRADLLDALSPAVKGMDDYGASDHLRLPGTANLRPLSLACSVDGQVYTVFFLDPGEVRTCPDHPGVELQPTPRL